MGIISMAFGTETEKEMRNIYVRKKESILLSQKQTEILYITRLLGNCGQSTWSAPEAADCYCPFSTLLTWKHWDSNR